MGSVGTNHLCITAPRIGPYHQARFNAAGLRGRVSVVELSRMDDNYAWDEIAEIGSFSRHTLFDSSSESSRDVKLVQRAMDAALDQIRPAVVAIMGWAMHDALAALRWCVRRRIPAVLMSESQRQDVKRTYYKEFIKRKIVSLFSSALVGGSSHREYLVELGMRDDKIFLGYDVVDNDHFECGARDARLRERELREAFALPKKYFLSSNRFIPKKNLSGLIRAYSLYHGLCGEEAWDLVLLGDGDERSDLEKLISQLGIGSSVHLLGFQQYGQLPIYYGLAEAFVHVSTSEQWGLVVNEAMAAGLPVVVSNACGCAGDLVKNGRNGFTFHPASTGELVSHLRALTSHGALQEMGAESRKIIAEWNPSTFGENLWKAANAALEEGPARTGSIEKAVLKLMSHRASA